MMEREREWQEREKLNLAILQCHVEQSGEFAEDSKAKAKLLSWGLIRHGPLTHAPPTSGNQLLPLGFF